MNFLKKGPELKVPELKVPGFLRDLYHDLKERHLLPLVALLLVALVALPIFINANHSEPEGGEVPPIRAIGSSAGGDEALVVAHSEPGLRDPMRRFGHARALDPFAKKNHESTATSGKASAGETAPAEQAPSSSAPVEATVVGGESAPPSSESSAVESSAPPAEISVPSTGSSGATSGSSRNGPTRVRYASNAIDVRIIAIPGASSSSDRKSKPKAETRRNLPELSMLPGRSTPAVTFMGPSGDGKKALLLVSSDVVSVFGEAKCVIGSQSCQLLALEPGMPETFVYGPRERTYRIELLKITRTLGAKPRRATLGATSHGKSREAGKSKAGGTPVVPAEPVDRGDNGSTAG